MKSFSKFSVPFDSIELKCNFIVCAHTKCQAKREAMRAEKFAPPRCFGTPKRIKKLFTY